MSTTERGGGAAGRFGTFGGVFTPCVLTILGVIMFLRFGFVVGQAGLYYALLIVIAVQGHYWPDESLAVGHCDQHASRGWRCLLLDQP